MFSATESGSSSGSWGTTETRARTLASVASRRSHPSTRTLPSSGSNSRGISETSVLLPAPVGPTSASVSPARTSRLTSRSTSWPGW